MEIGKIKKKLEYEEFHKFIMWGQEQNKKNPWKFGTVEIYTYIIDSLKILSHEMSSEDFKKFLNSLDIDYSKI